jgi:CheY-like chemotaxis protein
MVIVVASRSVTLRALIRIKTMHIFYCDDDQDDLFFFKSIVTRINPQIKLTLSSSPVEALEYLKTIKVKPNFIFFDCKMPQLDGIECAIAIKRNRHLKKIPLTMLSENLEGSIIQDYNKLGVYSFLSKTSLEDLEVALRGLIIGKT